MEYVWGEESTCLFLQKLYRGCIHRVTIPGNNTFASRASTDPLAKLQTLHDSVLYGRRKLTAAKENCAIGPGMSEAPQSPTAEPPFFQPSRGYPKPRKSTSGFGMS